jgi:hypothetical protein
MLNNLEIKSNVLVETQQPSLQQRISINDNKVDMKLVLNDSPQIV